MKDDKIYKEMLELLQKNKNEHTLDDVEMDQLAALINAVVKSTPDIRAIFYVGVIQIGEKVKKFLDIKTQEVIKGLIKKDDDKNNGGILN